MKTKILFLVIVAAVGIGGTTVIVLQKEGKVQKSFRPVESELPQAMSNYVGTFKIDTSPPLFPETKSGLTNRISRQQSNAAKP